MDEKPRFRDFYWGSWGNTGDARIYVKEKKSGLINVYDEPEFFRNLRILFIILCAFGSFIFVYFFKCDFWRNIYSDVFLIVLAVIFIFDILIWRIIYSLTNFRKLYNYEEINDTEMNPKKKTLKRMKIQRIFVISYVTLMFLFVFLNSYFFAYLRYLTESLTGGNPGTAQALIIAPQSQNIISEGKDVSLKIKNSDDADKIVIKIKTVKIPQKVYVYLNGEGITSDDIEYKQWDFWESDYFKKKIDIDKQTNIISGENTLEVKSDNFDRTWTFTLEQG